MKRTLAILLVALVALTSVFAGARTLTLTNTVPSAASEFEVYYGKSANPNDVLVHQYEDKVTSLATGTRYFAIAFTANSSEDVSDLTVSFENTPFVHQSQLANVKTPNIIPDNMKVRTVLEFNKENVTGVTTSIDNNTVSVSCTKYNKIDNAVVATGTLTWQNDNATNPLVAGNYTSTVTVTISTNN